jgi:hypothetical protein
MSNGVPNWFANETDQRGFEQFLRDRNEHPEQLKARREKKRAKRRAAKKARKTTGRNR